MLCAVILSIFTLEAKPLSVKVSAPSAILINSETGAILYEKEIHQKRFPASTTKIATAFYVLEKKGESLHERVAAGDDALMTVPATIRLSNHPSYRLEVRGTSARIRPGEVMTLSTLLYGLLLPSGNDAANVLAEAVSGNIDCFMQELNLFLKGHGISQTQFTNPHGLHCDNHWTTAYDMAQITRLALKHPVFRQIVKTARFSKPQSEQAFMQSNRLLREGPYFYSKAIGVKTGYTSRAGYNLVGAATHEGRTLIAVLLNCPENHDRFRDAIKLFEAAFSEKKTSRTLFAQGHDRFIYQIRGGTCPLQAALKEDAILEYYPAEEPYFRAEIEWRFKSLPVAQGDLVGHLKCIDEKGNLLLEKSLFASNSVEKQIWAAIVDYCLAHKSFFLALFLGGQVVLLLIYHMKKGQKVGKR